MSELRIIPVTFNGKRYIVTDHRMQYDWGQVLYFTDLELPDSFEARFSNAPTGESVGQIGSNNRIRIPKQFFESGEPIYCYITLHDEITDGRTVYTTKVPIKPSSERTEEEPEPEEESIITQAISALNTAVEKTAQDVESADALVQAASEQADRAEQAAEGVEGYAERAESAQTAAESARDITLEAKVSAQASAATATEKASEAISSATTASQSALTAENASESASASADASYQNAETAYRYAQDSATSAGQASGSAQTASSKASEASQKASEAAQSASTAVQAKTDAESAKTASETAQGLAEQARNDAVSAKTDAESARDEAQDIVDGITGKVEQIDSNTDRIESLEDDRYKPYAVDSASGSIASFPDGADDIPLKSCIVQIEPVQEGSGDPSPENVRPISGWTGCEVVRSGINIWNEEWELGGIVVATGLDYYTSSRIRSKGYCVCKPSTNYYVNQDIQVFFYDEAKAYIKYVTGAPAGSVITTPSNACYFRIVRTNASEYANNISVNYPSTDHDYHPYIGQAYPITFPSEAGTIYGGYIDPINGELVVNMATDDMGNLSWSTQGSVGRCYSTSKRDTIKKGSSAGGYNNVFAEIYSASIASGMSSLQANQMSVDSGGNIQLYDTRFAGMTGEQIKAELQGVTMCYELAEPIHYPLTPQEIKTLLGTNNVWANTGDTEVEYRADVTMYINKKIAEAVSALT